MPPDPLTKPATCPESAGESLQPPAFLSGSPTFVSHLEGVALFDADGLNLAVDANAGRWFADAPLGEREGRPTLADLLGDELAAAWLAELFELRSVEFLTATFRCTRENASLVEVNIRRLDGLAGPLAIATFRPSASESLHSRDPLTGLPDRRAIGPWLSGLPQDGLGARRPFAVLFLDLNDFKDVNDAHGHAAGDAVLTELANRWSNAVRDGDLVTRYGGDEFVILLRNVADVDAAQPVVERLRVVTLEPIAMDGIEVSLSATIGVAVSDEGDVSIENLIAAADEDMYARKRRRPK
ncbi:MAG: hypothetical protein C0485_03930 [Pirellula sp.]|nr:hypothetical protein [Pirellula sp.]